MTQLSHSQRPPAGTIATTRTQHLNHTNTHVRRTGLEQGDRACLGGPAADVEVELDGQVGLAECLPGMGKGFGFYAAVQGVQVG